jgi:uncharacterized protein YcbX
VSEPGRVVGRVQQVWLYPVKSLAGTPVDAAEIGPAGLAGDRARTVVDEAGRPVRTKDVPELATLSPADAGSLSAALGRTVRLEPLPPSPGVAPVHLVSRQAIERAALGDLPEGCSAEDPRANLLVDLDGDEDEEERAWVGRTLRIGDAVLEITRTPKHCLGVYAEVRRAGRVTVGDVVLI